MVFAIDDDLLLVSNILSSLQENNEVKVSLSKYVSFIIQTYHRTRNHFC